MANHALGPPVCCSACTTHNVSERPHTHAVVARQASVPALEANLAIPFNKAALPGVTMTVGSPRGVPAGAQQVGQEGLIALIQSLFWGREAAQTCASHTLPGLDSAGSHTPFA